jgi:hypothetical protein
VDFSRARASSCSSVFSIFRSLKNLKKTPNDLPGLDKGVDLHLEMSSLFIYLHENTINFLFLLVTPKFLSNDTPIYKYVQRAKLIHTIKLTVVDQQEEKPPCLPVAFQNSEEHV